MKQPLRFLTIALGLALVGLLTPSVSRADNLVLNGNFAAQGTDWTFTPAAFGSLLFFGPDEAVYGGVGQGYYDTLSQTLSTVAGDSYQVSFMLANSYGIGGDEANFQVLWDGSVIYNDPGTSAFGFTEFTVNTTGTGSDTVSFAGYQLPSYYYLTDVSVSNVTPEPSSFYLLGTGLLGLAAFAGIKARA